MSVDTMYVMRTGVQCAGFRDLDPVVLTAAVTTDEGARIEAGARGTVVGVWEDGAEFEVEFTNPVAGLATVPADALAADERV